MPFIAEADGDAVIPESVSDGSDVTCPACDEVMRPRGPFTDGTARHFFHLSTTDCSGGESDIHRKRKSLAVSGLRQQFGEQADVCRPEVELDTSSTLTEPMTRRADALLSFDEENPFYGQGIIVEVQHKNNAKDVTATTHDYLALGYSVYWAESDSFADDRFLTEKMLSAFDERAETARAPYYADPPAGFPSRERSGLLRYVLEETSDVVAYSNPYPDRDHDWIYRMSGTCYRCGLSRYGSTTLDEDIYVYDPDDISQRKWEYTERGNPPSDHEHRWRGVRSGPEGEQLECDCGAKRTHVDRTVVIDHGPGATWDITVEIPDNATQPDGRGEDSREFW